MYSIIYSQPHGQQMRAFFGRGVGAMRAPSGKMMTCAHRRGISARNWGFGY